MNIKKEIKKLSKVFAKEMIIVFEREKKESHFLNQDSYKNCFTRAEDGIDIATDQVKKILGLKIAKHRQSKHGENRNGEIQLLKSEIKPEYQKEGKADWWIL